MVALVLPGSFDAVRWTEFKWSSTKNQSPSYSPSYSHGFQLQEQIVQRIRVPKGTHTLTAFAQIKLDPALSLTLHDPPHQLQLEIDGWELKNQGGDRLENILTFPRLRFLPDRY